MTTIFNKSQEVLAEMIGLLQQLPDARLYSEPCALLNEGTIGQHTRHIIELYQCLLAGYEPGEVNYDARQRNKLLEHDQQAATLAMQAIGDELVKPDKAMQVVCGASDSVSIHSNYFREVLYNLEHCIHHQALIRVALIAAGAERVPAGFGVAPSTIEYRRQCAQ